MIEMMQSGRACTGRAQQLHADEKAIGNAKKERVQNHIEHCIKETSAALPREIKDLMKEFQGFTKSL